MWHSCIDRATTPDAPKWGNPGPASPTASAEPCVAAHLTAHRHPRPAQKFCPPTPAPHQAPSRRVPPIANPHALPRATCPAPPPHRPPPRPAPPPPHRHHGPYALSPSPLSPSNLALQTTLTDTPAAPTDTRPLILSGPSGVGKGTLYNLLFARHPDTFALSVSHTTRAPRAGEADGVHYHFVPMEDFEALIARGGFVEHAQFGGNRYGTSKSTIEEQTAKGRVVLLDIEMEVRLPLAFPLPTLLNPEAY